MGFCRNCGAQATEGVAFCPACGKELDAAAQLRVQPSRVYQAPVVPGAPTQTDIRDAQDNKTMAILAYILFLIPLLTGAHKTSAFARYHTNQGTVLFLFALAWGVVYWILTTVFIAILFDPATLLAGGWGALGIVTFILSLLWVFPAILYVVGIINAAGGQMKPLPAIGKIRIIK